MHPIAFAGQLTESDFRRVSALAGRRVVLGWTALIAILIIVLLARWSWEAFLADPVYTVMVFGLLVLTIPISLALRPMLLRRYWRSNALLRQPIKGEASDENLAWAIEGVSSNQVPWHLLLGYRESPSAVLVYVGLNQFVPFLPRYFGDPAEWQRLRALVASKLPRK
jgi:YcxB-like protein